jgi:hypothetical protein
MAEEADADAVPTCHARSHRPARHFANEWYQMEQNPPLPEAANRMVMSVAPILSRLAMFGEGSALAIMTAKVDRLPTLRLAASKSMIVW